MHNPIRQLTAVVLAAGTISISACGGHDSRTNAASGDVAATPTTATTPAPDSTHHSKLAGAAVGAVAGHVLGGHAVAGAAVGALVQHERNKHNR